MKAFIKCIGVLISSVYNYSSAFAEPPCVAPDAKNYVVANGAPIMADGWMGRWFPRAVITSKEWSRAD